MKRSLACLALALLGCAETPPATFVPDADPGGPALLLEVTPMGSTAHVRVLSRDLGPVLGVAAHVRVDPALVAVRAGDDTALRAALDPELDGLVRVFVAPGAGDVALGATRTSVLAGEADLGGEHVLLELDLDALTPASSALSLTDVIVRRADGSFVDANGLGGILTLTGAP